MRSFILTSILLSGCVTVPKTKPVEPKIVMKKLEVACVTTPPPMLSQQAQNWVVQSQLSEDGSKGIFLIDMPSFMAFGEWFKAERIWTELTWDSCHLKP